MPQNFSKMTIKMPQKIAKKAPKKPKKALIKALKPIPPKNIHCIKMISKSLSEMSWST